MGVTVQHGSTTIDSTEDNAETVSASLTALDKAAPPETPTPPPAVEPADAETQDPDAGEGSARARDEAGRFVEGDSSAAKIPPQSGKGSVKPEPAEKRIAKITWQREEAKRQAAAETARREALEKELAELRKGAAPAPPAPPAGAQPAKADAEPQLEDFETYEQYTRALARWEVRQELAQARQQEQQTKAQTEEEQRVAAFRERQAAWNAANPAKVAEIAQGAASQTLPPAMISAILASEQGPDLLHFLATHPEECLQLVAETEHLAPTAAPVVRRALERFLAPSAAPNGPAKAVTRFPDPAPIQPVGANPVVPESDPTALPFGKEYVRQMNARDFERERRRRGLMPN